MSTRAFITSRVLTQYQPRSLNEHIGIGKPWDLDRDAVGCGFCSRIKGHAARQAHGRKARPMRCALILEFITESDADHVLILAGDHIYKMDYNALLHVAHAKRTRM